MHHIYPVIPVADFIEVFRWFETYNQDLRGLKKKTWKALNDAISRRDKIVAYVWIDTLSERRANME